MLLRHPLPLLFLALLLPAGAWAAAPPCRPCAGVRVDDPAAFVPLLAAAPRLEGEARLYVSWPVELDDSADTGAAAAVAAAGGTPWLELLFRTPAPVLEHLATLDGELRQVARLAAAAGEHDHFQVTWRPATGAMDPTGYAFLLKRAAVAITGARPDARVITGPLAPDPAALAALYGEEVAAYVDGVAVDPAAGDPTALLEPLTELDPGKPLVVDARPWPAAAGLPLAGAAEDAAAGFALTFFHWGGTTAEELAPLKLLARDFQGDLSYDPDSGPRGPGRAWSFVRGEDLTLRVVVEPPAGRREVALLFPDPQLKGPERIDLADGERQPLFDQRRSAEGLQVTVDELAPVVVLAVDRMSAAELEGVEEKVTVEAERELPVEEILRRLQAFEDAQARRLERYSATNTMHLRFRIGGTSSFEATFEGPFFFRRGEPFDWAWERFYVNGVRWKGKKLPEIPLIQPEKAAALPLEIHFSKEYRYRLRGTADVDGRSAWVVDFEPAAATTGTEGKLYQGTVWVDRELYCRLKTRALQVGLEGDVLSNEETTYFAPLDTHGQPAPWSAGSYFLPVRMVGQELLSVLNSTTQVEKETLLSAVQINDEAFDKERQAALDSESTMVRDTDQGLRYLVKDEGGERVVKEGFDTNRLFLVGGAFYDSTLKAPLPLAGVNYLALDFRGTGNQANLFFAGPLVNATYSDPSFVGSRWDAGLNLFGLFIGAGDQLFRDGEERPEEEVKRLPVSLGLSLGHPLGSFGKLDFDYLLSYARFRRADDTAEGFVLPQSTMTHTLRTTLTYQRAGYRARLRGGMSRRSDWAPWGLPGNSEYDPDQQEYVTWDVSLAKTWWLRRFFKFGVELEHLDGADLDRFSKYDFGFFGDATVRGYPNGFVRAAEADGVHLDYGFDLFEAFRVELKGDAVWATDEATGLDRELLAGVGLNGTVRGPWQTIVNFDLGYPVAGPAEDPVAYIAFLKLFH